MDPLALVGFGGFVALDGSLKVDKQTFRLYGARVPGREYICTYASGRKWACGLRSYVALVNLIGSALLECRPKSLLKPDRMICHRGTIDLAEWMLRHGWARLESDVDDTHYVEAAHEATAQKVGIWSLTPIDSAAVSENSAPR